MVQGRDGPRLALEAGQAIGVLGDLVGEDLDRDLAAQAGVAGAVDLPHAAGPEEVDDLVRPESGSGQKRHVRASGSEACDGDYTRNLVAGGPRVRWGLR